MNNSPANVAGGGRVGVDLKRLLPGRLRFLSAFLVVGTALAATSASAQGRVYFNMASVPDPVAEGDNATFTVCPPSAELASAEVEVTVVGDVIDGPLPTMVDFTGPSLCAEFHVPTAQDAIGEEDGVITAEILCPDRTKRNAKGECDAAGAAYWPGLFGSNIRKIIVEDDDGGPTPAPPPTMPEVTIAADTTSVTEGTAAEFTLTRTGDTTAALTVTVTVDETGSTISGTAPTSATFQAGSGTAALSVATDDDAMEEPDSTVTAAVSAGTGYTVGTPSSAAVLVTDDDDAPDPPVGVLPSVTIAAAATPVTEGTAAEFTLTRTGDAAAALTVTVAVSETGSTIAGTVPTTVDFAAGSATATLSVATDNDSLDEPDSTVTAAVSAGADYTVGSPGSATVGVTDDDMAVDDGDAPLVYFNMGPTEISEGAGKATFTLFRQSTNAITVNVQVTETEDMIEMAPVTVEFPAGATSRPLTVVIDDDDEEEDNSVITATILDGTGYDPGAFGSDTAQITVIDNDAPGDDMPGDGDETPVDPNLPSAPQGFEPTPGDHSVALAWVPPASDGGAAITHYEYQCEGGIGCDGTWTMVAGGASARGVTIDGLDNGRVRRDGSVDGPSYMFHVRAVNAAGGGAAAGPTSATPIGPDVEISIAADMDAVTEGEAAVFTLTRFFNPLSQPFGDPEAHLTRIEVAVRVSVDDESMATVREWPMMVTIPQGEKTAKLTVATEDDMLDEIDSVVTASLVDMQDPGYRVSDTVADRTDTIMVMDDDEAPTATIADAMALEEDGEIMFTISLDGPSGKEITVDWATGDDGSADMYDAAVADTDYMASSGSVVFMPQNPASTGGTPGETEHTIVVPVTDDMLDEHDESFTVSISAMAGVPVMIADGEMATGTIQDDDAAPSVSIADMSGDESGDLMFAVTLDAPSGLPIVLDWMTGDMETPEDMYGMATADVDYTAVDDGMVEFVPAAAGMAGPTEMMITVSVDDDMLDEHDEVFGVTLTPQMPDYVMVADGMATGEIVDNDDPPTVSIADGSAAEMVGEVTFDVTLSAPSGLPISVAYATGDMETPEDMYGMATAGDDYTSGTGMVEFAPGETEMMVTVTVMDDALDEHDEVFAVTLSDASYAMIDDGMATGTIMDDDDAPMVSIADDSAPEAEGMLTFDVTLDAPSALPISVAWATGDMATPDDMYGMATADVDYASASGTVEFAPGETAMWVDVVVMEDALDEHHEVFAVNLGEASYATVDDGMAVGTIEDDDDAPAVTVADASASEGAGPLVFTVSLDAPSGLPTSVDWATGDAAASEDSYLMAHADVDYTAAGGTVEFAAGETEIMVEIELLDDAIDEMDELFGIVLTNPMYAVFDADAEAVAATGTIMDDDDAPTLSIADASAVEASGAVTFIVTIDAPSGLPISTDWATGDMATPDDLYGMATADVDYMSANGTAEVAPGDTETMITVTIMDDHLDEHDEVFGVTLSHPHYVMIGDGEAMGTIEDDDDAPTMSIADASGPENAGSLVFDVTLSAPSGLPIMADYATADETAMAGEDYAATMGTLEIAPGGTSATVTVPIMDDDVYESAAETFHVNLSGAMYSTLDDGSAVGTITNEDPAPTLAIGDSTATESDGQMTFTITKSGATALDATVDWATSDGTARAGEDYANSSGSVTFAPGSTSMSITVAIMADDRYEGEENFTVTLSGPMMSTLDDASATGTITDDDAEAVVQAWLARFGRTVATHVVDAVGGRLTEEPIEASVAELRLGGYAVGATDDVVWGGSSRLSMAGQRPGAMGDPLFNPGVNRGFNPGIDATFGQAWGGGTQGPWVGSRNSDFGNLLSRSSFHFSAAGSNPGDSFALWGRGAMTSFSGDDGALSHDGDVTTGTVGVDFETGKNLFGIGMSHSQGDGEFSGSASGLAGGSLDSTLTLFHPYVRVNINECTSIWGLVGTGSGDLTLTNGAGGAAIDTDIEMTMGAAGFRGPLQAGLGDFGLEVKSDVFVANMSADAAPGLESVDADASRARVALQGSNTTELEGGGLFTPMFEAGLRYDGGDAETGAGVEIGGGLRFADASRRVSLQLNARALLAHSESEYEEWGLGASVVVHPNASGQGVTFNLRSAWGEVASGVDAMWSRYDAAALVNRGERSLARRIGARYDAELGYGLNAPGGRNVLVPYVAAGVSDIGTRDYRLGLRLRSDANMDLRFEVDRREGLGFEPDHGVVLRGWLFW